MIKIIQQIKLTIMKGKGEVTEKKIKIQYQASSSEQINKNIAFSNKKVGKWTKQEHQKYVAFLEFYKKELKTTHRRRKQQIFKIMSHFILRRDPIQCRTHHVKQMKSLGNISQIIRIGKQQFESVEYHRIFEEIVRLSEICSNVQKNTNSSSDVEVKKEETELKVKKVKNSSRQVQKVKEQKRVEKVEHRQIQRWLCWNGQFLPIFYNFQVGILTR